MSSNTAIAGLTYPSLADAPNVPSDIQRICNQLDTLVVPKYTTKAARDAAIPSPTDGQQAYRQDIHAPQFYHGGLAAWSFAGTIPIAKQVLGTDSSSVTFNNIPQEFTHLLIIAQGRTADAAAYSDVGIRFNNDTSAAYSTVTIWADGSSSTPKHSWTSNTGLGTYAFIFAGANADANISGAGHLVIPNYTSTTYKKNAYGLGGLINPSTNAPLTGTRNVNWANASAITSVSIIPSSGGSLKAASIFELYGIG